MINVYTKEKLNVCKLIHIYNFLIKGVPQYYIISLGK